MLAISFFPRIAFAAQNRLKSLRTGIQPNNITRLVIETESRPSYSLEYQTAPAAQLIVKLSNCSGSASPTLTKNTLIKSLATNASGDKLIITAALTKTISEIKKDKILILEPNGETGYRLVLDMSAGMTGATVARETAAASAAPKKTKRVIVIDAGHGGKDPGCIGITGVREKNVVLATAKKLRDRLASAGFSVYMTRATDVFLNLDTRAGIAEKHHADLFLSLHANANPSRDMKGFSVYTLSKKASDEEAQKLADAENAADKIDVDGFEKFEPNIRSALSALQQNAVAEMSLEFANGAVKTFRRSGIREQERPLRSAPFAVLKSTIPSALIELGHLSNREEEKLLNTGAHQDKCVDAIVRAVNEYDFSE